MHRVSPGTSLTLLAGHVEHELLLGDKYVPAGQAVAMMSIMISLMYSFIKIIIWHVHSFNA